MNLRWAVVIVVALLVAGGVIWYLWAVSPTEVSEGRSLKLTIEQNPPWRDSICIPGTQPGSPSWTNVSFFWNLIGPGTVTLVVWPAPHIPDQAVYNETGSTGTGWYSSQGTEFFAAFGAGSASDVVEIELSYVIPGHTLSGPIVGPTC